MKKRETKDSVFLATEIKQIRCPVIETHLATKKKGTNKV
jgi:hypothetical protein